MSHQLSKKKQDELIALEIERLFEIFSDLSDDKKKVAQRLIERVAFMTITLQLLEDQIKNQGPVYNFKNGKQKMVVEHPAQKSYNSMIQRYTAAYDKLFGLLPKDDPRLLKNEDDEFDNFVNSR